MNCRGQNAFGRRKRQIFDDTDASLSTSVSDYVGQLREEVTVQSNPILALERREERLTDPSEGEKNNSLILNLFIKNCKMIYNDFVN